MELKAPSLVTAECYADQKYGLVTEGELLRELLEYYHSIHVYCGSFNPVHEGHKTIAQAVNHYARLDSEFTITPTLAMAEMCVAPRGKEIRTLELDQVREVSIELKLPVFISDKTYFIDKAEQLSKLWNRNHNITFHVGIDTLIRLINDTSEKEVNDMPCRFIYYPRAGYHNTWDFWKIRNAFVGYLSTYKYNGLSSTAIRENLTPKSEGCKVYYNGTCPRCW